MFCSFLSAISANEDTIQQRSAGLHLNYGFIIPHSKAIAPVSGTNPVGIGLDISRYHTSPEDRHVFNACWIAGIRAAYFNFQNPGVLGGAYTLTVYAEPVVAFSNNFLFSIRGGAGLSCHTKIYDEDTNPSNQFFSTRISFPLYVNARFKFRVSDRMFLLFSANYDHISNGGFRQPNCGMNFPTLGTGLEYFPEPYRLPEQFKKERGQYSRNIFFATGMLSAVRVADKTDLYPEEKTLAVGFHAVVSKPLGNIYSLNAGAEMIFDGYIKEMVEREQSGIDYKRFALLAGQDFRFGNFYFSQYLGIYLYSPYKAKNPVYQKYVLQYRFRNGITAGVFLKAHLHEAEIMGMTVGWMIPR